MNPIDILMVEDNPGDILLVQEAVEELGLPYRIHVVHDGVEATEYLWAHGRHAGAARPDLVVLDMKLPRKGGREVLDDLRRDPALGSIPVVLLSSSRSEMDLARTLHAPLRRSLVKPSTFKGYLELVRAIEAFRRETETAGQPVAEPGAAGRKP